MAVELLGAHLPPGWRSSNGPCGGSGSWVEAVHCVAPAQLGAEAPVVAAPWSTAMGDPLLWHLPGMTADSFVHGHLASVRTLMCPGVLCRCNACCML